MDQEVDNHLESREDLFNWTVDIHNSANHENNKKITAISDNPEPSLAYKILHTLN